jgi:vitamin B12 transporter
MTHLVRPGTLPGLLCALCLLGSVQNISAQGAGAYPRPGEGSGNPEEWDETPVMEGDGITITGTRETTQQIKIIGREEIEKAHAPDLAALLEETAGLGTARYGPRGSQGDINLRGFDGERVAFLIDGIPANSPGSGEFDYNRIDLASVERIEIIYGCSDSRYNVSGAIGGVINIVTVKKQKPGLHLSGGISNTSAMPGGYYKPRHGNRPPQWQDLFDTQNITLSAGQGLDESSWSVNWFGNRAANHFLYDDPYGRRRRKESSEVWDTGMSAAFIRDLPDLAKLIVNGSFYYGNKNVPTSGYSDIAGKEYDYSTRENLMLEMPRIFHDTLAMEASLSHGWERTDFLAPPSDTLTDLQSLSAVNRWSWYPLEALTLRAGGDYRYVFMDSGVFHDRHDGGVYVTAEWSPHKTFTVIPSVKVAAKNGGPVVPVPKLGLLWKPVDSLTIKNNYFRSFKFPDLEDLYWRGGGDSGDPSLKPEDGWGGDLGAAWTCRTDTGLGFGLEGNGFAQWYDNSIHWYSGGGGWKPQNVGGAFFYGADAAARLELPLSRGPFTKAGLSVSYQYMMSYLLAYGYTFGSDKRIPYMPVHSAGASAELFWETGSFTLSGRYTGERFAELGNITILDPHVLLTAGVDQKIGKNFAAFAVFRSALNRSFSYQTFYDYPMPGNTLTLGLKTSFDWTPAKGSSASSGSGG